jgi:hypothetical protein
VVADLVTFTRDASASSSAGVRCGSGPSSNVSAIRELSREPCWIVSIVQSIGPSIPP